MKREEMVDVIVDELAGDLNYNRMPLIVASELLAKLEEKGMLPPEVSYNTPLGAQTALRLREWEENIKVDEAGYELGENPYDPNCKQAKVIK